MSNQPDLTFFYLAFVIKTARNRTELFLFVHEITDFSVISHLF